MADVRFRKYVCMVCGYVYDEEKGDQDSVPPISVGTRWEDVPINWVCPECGARKEEFEIIDS